MIADAVILALPNVPLQAKQLLPEYSGIYHVLDETHIVWYIGQAKNIRKRWQAKAHHRLYQLEAQKKKHFTIYYEPISESLLDSVEKQRIEKYHPHLNSSPVKKKTVRPTETLLRESIAAISDFAFLLGVEPPRKELPLYLQAHMGRLPQKQKSELSIIHICLDIALLQEKFSCELEELAALLKKAFSSRKVYANKWEIFPPVYPFIYSLCVNGYLVEVNYWSRWHPQGEQDEAREYVETTLAQESIRALTPEFLTKIQNQADGKDQSVFYLKRLNPYRSDLIKLLFNEPVDSEAAKQQIRKLSEEYKVGIRGIGSRSRPRNSKLITSEFITIEELLAERGIDINKYGRNEVISIGYSGERIGLYLQLFSTDMKMPLQFIYGFLNNKKIRSVSSDFDTVYLLASVDKKGWLLVEESLKDFVIPATTVLSNGVGYMEKFYISPRKYIVPAKVNIRLENIGYSVWIPFGISPEFPTFAAAKEEINKRLKSSDLPGLKLAFKQERIEK